MGVGSLLRGYYEGDTLRFAGKVGTGAGWTDAFSRALRARLEEASPLATKPRGALFKNAHWVEPRLVADVQFSEWTDDGHIRDPSLQGFRLNTRAADVRRE